MLLAILLFITVNYPSVGLAAPVCDDTNIGPRELVLPGGDVSPGVDLTTPTIILSQGIFSDLVLGQMPNYYNCHVTSGDSEIYKLYIFLEPLTSYGSSYALNIGRPAYGVIAMNAPAFGVGFASGFPLPPGIIAPSFLIVTFGDTILPGLLTGGGYYYISLVNGSLLQPGILSGRDLPTFGIYGIIYKNDGTPYDGKKILMGSLSFSGSLNVIPFTCQTPDVVVPMGNYKTTDFTGVGSTSQWVDFNIELDNCPGNYPGYFQAKNQMSLLVNPVYGNPTPDSFSLKSGTGSATGIDMQIRKKNDTSLITMGTGFDPLGPVTGNTGVKQLRIPLQARYIQSGGQVTPGLAESALTFTINYY
ncbi:TPA: type 1 fimbrial protein [Citrobacter sedlakii]|nr:type 1 fimbrial protein [Citrobacter sedlakii]HCA7135099.1 type 1 fimbrial protein [Citrobacter sedlakii]HCA7181405.1 type 1 fimbrial protein [Citrobacter sedlakii]